MSKKDNVKTPVLVEKPVSEPVDSIQGYDVKKSVGMKPQKSSEYAKDYYVPDGSPEGTKANKEPLKFDLTIDYYKLFEECGKNKDEFIQELMKNDASNRVIVWQNGNRPKFDYLLDRVAKGNTDVMIQVSKVRHVLKKSPFEIIREIKERGNKAEIKAMIDLLSEKTS